jgi:hypothetical protein
MKNYLWRKEDLIMDETENYIDIYTHIGRFVVQFEQICHQMEIGISSILLKEGLKNTKIHEILLAGFTAEPLSALFQSLCKEHLKPDIKTSKIINYVFNTFRDLISVRNDVLHGKFVIVLQQSGRKNKPIALYQKLQKNKNGSASKKLEYDIDKFKTFLAQADLSLSNMLRLSACIADHGCPIDKNNFIEDKDEF